MAGRVVSLRGIHRIVTAVRPSAARPGVAKWISSAPRCSQQQSMLPSLAVATSRLHTQHWRRQEVVQCRRYAGGGTTMTLSELQEQVINVLKMFDKIDPDKVNLKAHFVNDLGLDSLDVVEIVMAFEDEFGIEIDDDQAEKIFTATDAVEFLKVKLDVH